jgi:hypothetical protein
MYAPSSTDGSRLLAHEVAHVVQQSSGREPTVALKSSGVKIGAPNDPLEIEADQAAEAYLKGTPRSEEENRKRALPSADSPSILRQEASPSSGQSTVVSAPTPRDLSVGQEILKDNISAVLEGVRARPVSELVALRTTLLMSPGVRLEHWFVEKLRRAEAQKSIERYDQMTALTNPVSAMVTIGSKLLGADQPPAAKVDEAALAEEGLRWIWPALPLIDRMLVYDEGYREIEKAQLDTIKHSTREERDVANADQTGRLDKIYDAMDAKEEYEARTFIDPSPAGLWKAALALLGETRRWKNKDLLYDAILKLAPADRRTFFDSFQTSLATVLWPQELQTLKILAHADEAGALIARLRLATEDRRDDMEAVQAIVDRAVSLLSEKQKLVASKADSRLSPDDQKKIDDRLRELETLESLLQMRRRDDGSLDPDTFMGKLSAARDDPDAFAADTAALAPFGSKSANKEENFNYQAAKQRLLLAKGDSEATLRAFLAIHAPPVEPKPGESNSASMNRQHEADVELRTKLLMDDPDVHSAFVSLVGSEQMHVLSSFKGDAFSEALVQLNHYQNTAQWGEFFNLVLTISRNDDWRARYNDTSTDPFGVFARTFGDEREIMLSILRTRHIPLAALLDYTGNVATLQAAFANLSEDDRTKLREGWAVAHNLVQGKLTPEQESARNFYVAFEQRVRDKQGSGADFEDVLGAGLGSMATVKEMSTDEGRYNAVALMYARISARLALDRGMAAEFTEADETMVAAGREFAAIWLRVRDQRKLSWVEFGVLAELNETFLTRSKEFTEASHAITDLAATIAATVAGVVVVAATGGMAAPAVIALAAAAGAGTGIVTREMFGGDYYRASSDEARKAMLMDSINGALAVVSGGLAAKGTQLLGLSGKALTAGAIRAAGTVAEEATVTFGQKVAASAVESALDGFFSGAVSEGFSTMMNDANWRKGIWAGILQAGRAALEAGLIGMGTGGLLGAATPVLGKGYSALKGLVRPSLERRLAEAGAKELFDRALVAAQKGDVKSVNALIDKMEGHLSSEEANLLRRELNEELEKTLGKRPGGQELTKEDLDLLHKTGLNDGILSPEELRIETSFVEGREPLISSEPGYVDEVPLENGHTWRRKENGTWCRFSGFPTNCNTTITAKPPSPEAVARSRRFRFDGERLPLASSEDKTARAAGLENLKKNPPPRPANADEAVWDKYMKYYNKRLEDLAKKPELKPPLTFESYDRFMRRRVTVRGYGFQSEEAREILRRFEGDEEVSLSAVEDPHIIEVPHEGGVKRVSETKRVDVLIYHPDEGYYVAFSFKSREFDNITGRTQIYDQIHDDVKELIEKYSGNRFIRSEGPDFGKNIDVNNIILGYEKARIRTFPGATPELMRRYIEEAAGEVAASFADKNPKLRIAVKFF